MVDDKPACITRPTQYTYQATTDTEADDDD